MLSLLLISVAVLALYWSISYFIKHSVKQEAIVFLVSRFIGGIIFMSGALWIVKLPFLSNAGLHFSKPFISFGFIGAGIIISYVYVKKVLIKDEKNISMYPQIRLKEWSKTLMIANHLSWMIYLTGYEIFFRGALFYYPVFVLRLPVIKILIINIMLYSLAHFPKGKTEIIGSIPVGIIMCLSVYYFQNIYFPVVVHWFMAWFNESLSFKANKFSIK